MRTDPRAACVNEQEKFWWAVLHDLVAHPLMALTNWSRWSLRFHDWTSYYAWPRVRPKKYGQTVTVNTLHFGALTARMVGENVWTIPHPKVAHALTVTAGDGIEAVSLAERWFDELAEEYGGNFARLA